MRRSGGRLRGLGGRRNRRVDREGRAERARRVWRAIKLGGVLVGSGVVAFHAVRLADSQGWLDLFRIRTVRVVGASITRPDVLVAEAGLMGADLHLWSPLQPYAERVERDPMIATAGFERDFPNRLVLTVVERAPLVFLELDRLAPVDSTGRVLPVTAFQPSWDVPILRAEWPAGEIAREGTVRLEPVREMLTWLERVAAQYPALAREISSIDLARDGTIVLHLVHVDGEIVLDGDTPIQKVGLVDDVVGDLRRKGISFVRLDLRFNDQIVVRRG